MAVDVKEDMLLSEVYLKEAYLCGILWATPEMYSYYSAEKLGVKHSGNAIWKFFLGLGRHLYEEKKINVFDDISVSSAVVELGLQKKYEKFGGYEVIEELMIEVKDKIDNFDGYYQDVKKYSLLRELRELFGKKVTSLSGKYDYKKMSREDIQSYWSQQLDNISMENSDSANQEYDLLDGLKEFVNEMNEEPDIGLPYYKSKLLHEMTNGWAHGTISILSAFSGNGKTSFVVEKFVMACIENKEKLLIIANEMDVKQYQKYLLITIMGSALYDSFSEHFKNRSFNRKNLNKGDFTDEEKAKLIMAVKWVEEKTNKDSSLIKFVGMESYTMDNVESVLRYYARRGYDRVIIDTAKPSEGRGLSSRWEQFVDDFDRLYKLARKDSGGLNLAMVTTVQSADTALNMRYLNEQCLADGKKIKNVVDVVWHMRPAWEDELEGGSKELKVTRWLPPAPNDMNDKPKSIPKIIKLNPTKIYYLLFCSKNRRGMANPTGLDVLVYRSNFNANRWSEVGFAKVMKDAF